MGLQEMLSYDPPRSSWWRRAAARLAATRPGSRLSARILPPLDRWSFKATGGRVALTESIGGLPTVMLTTRGSKSGLPRTVPLLAVPSGDDLAVLGTNWGKLAWMGS